MIKQQKKKKSPWRRIEFFFEKKPLLRKKFWSIYREVLSVTWPNFTVVKYNSKMSIIYHQTKFRKGIMNRSFIKKRLIKRLQHRCFHVNIAKYLRTPVLKNICERLFEHFPTWANNIKQHSKWRRHFLKKKTK